MLIAFWRIAAGSRDARVDVCVALRRTEGTVTELLDAFILGSTSSRLVGPSNNGRTEPARHFVYNTGWRKLTRHGGGGTVVVSCPNAERVKRTGLTAMAKIEDFMLYEEGSS